jgi:hypothetical protein
MPTWLWRSIVSTSAIIALVSVLQWGSCRFYVLPIVWPWYAKYIGTANANKLDLTLIGCNDVDARTVATMMGVLTTLISLSRKAD